MSDHPPPAPANLRDRLSTVSLRDEVRLGRRLDGAARLRDESRRRKVLGDIEIGIAHAESALKSRRAILPHISYPTELPISGRRDDIAAALRDHQVVVIAGETGSGKTTQIPKICLELGRGVRAMIGHTQPRRLAARTVAERIAEELGGDVGDVIGYQVRFTDQVSNRTLVKVMTDGILLNEMQRDRMLHTYDTIVIDEAHERSLNIDFILGYLHRLLPRRSDLKVVITSATIDPQRFADHFSGAPIIEVSGRRYPVETRYRPVVDPEQPERDQVQAVCDAVGELIAEGPGDILAFCSGEREIRDTADALTQQAWRDTDILPLYARLSAAEQHRIFQPHTRRRIVLATNVAETSLTVPGIRYVIDPGTARISRYSKRLKVQRLPIEAISQASADQRKGRCGRTADGICIRLYTEEDFTSRPAFTDPEILRTSLASVILQMIALDLGAVEAFPFLDPPDRRSIRDGIDLLVELGAIEAGARGQQRLTAIGRTLAQLPLDPRLARMVLEADRLGCLRDVLIIVAALSIQDPRERPADHQQAADAKHARFADATSDFAAYLNLWRYLRERRKELSSNQFRRMCREEFLHYLRVREWQDVHVQLRSAATELGMALGDAVAAPEAVSRSLLAGLLSQVGLRDDDGRDYLGARGARFAIWPGSALARKPPPWVMAAELVETRRLWARDAARTDPAWIEAAAGHLVKRTYAEPHWEKHRGEIVALERVTLYGIPLVAGRRVSYGRIDPTTSRELFIRHALVDGDWDTRHAFFAANRALIAEVESLEERVRRRDIRVDDETLYTFYDERVGAEVVSRRHFDTWWKQTRRQHPDLLDFETSLLVRDGVDEVDPAEYPMEWHSEDLTLPVRYAFDPGAPDDGVTVDVPLDQLNRLDPNDFLWQVPGNREELLTALIKSLPKEWRRQLVPAPDHARALLERLTPGDRPLVDAVADELRRMTGVVVPPDAFDLDRVPGHLRVTFRVVENGQALATDKDLHQLRGRLRGRLRAALTEAATRIERTGMTSWDLAELPRVVEQIGGRVRGYPALVDEVASVGVRVFEDEPAQAAAMRAGTRRLLLLSLSSPLPAVVRQLDNRTKLALAASAYPSVLALLEDCWAAAADAGIAERGVAWTAAEFAALRERVRSDVADVTLGLVRIVAEVLELAASVGQRLDAMVGPEIVIDDMRTQLAGLIHDGFVLETGRDQLRHLPRYLQAMLRRLDRMGDDPVRDAASTVVVHDQEDAYDRLVEQLPEARRTDRDVCAIRWSIEELRVSLFAQTLGTAYPVSIKRIRRMMAAVSSLGA